MRLLSDLMSLLMRIIINIKKCGNVIQDSAQQKLLEWF